LLTRKPAKFVSRQSDELHVELQLLGCEIIGRNFVVGLGVVYHAGVDEGTAGVLFHHGTVVIQDLEEALVGKLGQLVAFADTPENRFDGGRQAVGNLAQLDEQAEID
jgi:hypothetical protein